MYCIACQFFKENCTKVQIYASGYLFECPFYGKDEPIISSTGCNLQVMVESIGHPGGPERVDITPMKPPGKLTWYAQIMICYDGHGTITTTKEEITIVGTAIWIAWQKALIEVKSINKPGLNHLIPLIENRIQFDHSMLKYKALKVPLSDSTQSIPEEKKIEIKPKRIIIPEKLDHLMDVGISENNDKSAGDQMDLFAV